MVGIDLSCNSLYGEIPEELTSLSGLNLLNLSRNKLTGDIPYTIGKLTQLESLDLSLNQLFGPIPQSIASLDSLEVLNLSFNNLSGQIPSGRHLQTFNDPSIYEGNPGLCGPPLSKTCSSDGSFNPEPVKSTHDEVGDMIWFYVSMILGFVFGFWGIVGPLLFKTYWRYRFYSLVDRIQDRFF
ncbi:hypothetical protein LUZ60_002310 [Juncus effusus]|nr:hypothetical protein LUZ60_002310 [Juncus effusus]